MLTERLTSIVSKKPTKELRVPSSRSRPTTKGTHLVLKLECRMSNKCGAL